ncbi:putative glucosamine-fructose-6-phosphate aminotransferase [Listeria fleischmannii 1991]|uniref:Glucosamine--fructose-6-phosphate aminotransferase [isomerizing] n=2 Tax=Listeria fleischmannii TaxID=1069827 RepID=A0A2X3HDR4_9LIST|nr:SIS domain-containing protein [Listeria fleischmannii]EMG28781.1 putative glucosamine-fructose-6-phosphate aminotransferase [Listeria fleischmannii subsp. fleischmannii LU2006-1]KMT60144.1 putative glucosamine-fructose-6-phosphate aminotransferase [Listeria fleischmannii 1991]SQC68815.1 Glucosamine--fructose-6-phosphate aminotransferase [isomerizing] [Listeria fleischmannii subsp. fleischmannii]
MKNMEDYIHKEPSIYKNLLENRKQILEPMIKWAHSEYRAVVIFATGSSSNAAFSAQLYMSAKLGIPVYIEEPSLSGNYMLHLDKNTLYIAISQGGHSYSTIHLVKEIEKQGGTIFTITSDLASPIAKEAKLVIGMGMEVEEMPYVTAGYSATILILNLLALELALAEGKITPEQYEFDVSEMKKIATELPNIIEKSTKWVAAHTKEWMSATRIFFIGYGSTYGVAREGETKVTETIRITAFGKELEEYMHGPYIGLDTSDNIIFLEPEGQLMNRADKLKEFLRGHVPHVQTIYADQGKASPNDLALHIQTDELLASLYMTIPIHLLAFRISQEKGIDLEKSAFPEFDKITASKI